MTIHNVSDLNDKQVEFIKNNAITLFKATMLQPNDDVENIMQSTCACCAERRAFLARVLSMN